jgi:hypothetical protein
MALDYNLIGQLTNNTTILSIGWMVGLLITAISTVLISRDKEDVTVLAFPLLVGWAIAGLRTSPVILSIAAIVFVISTLSLKGIRQILSPKAIQSRREGITAVKKGYKDVFGPSTSKAKGIIQTEWLKATKKPSVTMTHTEPLRAILPQRTPIIMRDTTPYSKKLGAIVMKHTSRRKAKGGKLLIDEEYGGQ